jgi:acetyltransferase-like isoleucine patch superfamily enzyme
VSDVAFGSYVVVHAGVRFEGQCTVQDGAVLGKPLVLGPRSRAKPVEEQPTVLGEGCVVGAYAVLVAGARLGRAAVLGDHAFLREGVEIAEEAVVGGGAQVGSAVRIGARTKLMNGVLVARGSVIEEDVFVGPGVVLTNDPTMGRRIEGQELQGAVLRRGCRIGAGAILLPGVEVGEEAVVGAGSLVTRDVASRTLVMGSPAREARRWNAATI